MKYTIKYFKSNFPEWKRKKDSILVRYFFRPISFLTASICANLKINANAVSIFSIFIALCSGGLFLINNHICHIVGACLIAVWMILDCTDGNLARSVKKQAYGEFVDSCSSYCLIAFLFVCVGMACYNDGGLLIPVHNNWIIFAGAMASITDPLARLIYHKYLSDPASEVASKEEGSELSKSSIRKLQDRIDKEIGLNGIFIPFAIISAIFNWLDIFVLFYCAFYALQFLATTLYLILKSIKFNKNNL